MVPMIDFLVIRINASNVHSFYLNVSKNNYSLVTFILIMMTSFSGLATLNCVYNEEIDGFHKALKRLIKEKKKKMMEIQIEIIILRLD